jgi:hypothetical protein
LTTVNNPAFPLLVVGLAILDKPSRHFILVVELVEAVAVDAVEYGAG